MVLSAINCAWHYHTWVSRVTHALDIFRRVRGIPDQRKFSRSRDLLKLLPHQQCVVLGLHPADIKKISATLQPQAYKRLLAFDWAHFSPIRNEFGSLAI